MYFDNERETFYSIISEERYLFCDYTHEINDYRILTNNSNISTMSIYPFRLFRYIFLIVLNKSFKLKNRFKKTVLYT